MFEAKINSAIVKLQAGLDDARKVDAGKTGAPGTRLRKMTLDVTKDLKHIRESVSEIRNSAD
jgi:hypothetical protein